MKLSISNIAWIQEKDEIVYQIMKDTGFTGLEIAPTRIFQENPYNMCYEAKQWAYKLWREYGFNVSSMQSIWFGRQEKLFGSAAERNTLLEYTKKAIEFARTINCGNLVFGCPCNRNFPEGADERTAIGFFREIGDYAAKRDTIVSMEANPPIYNTNYINDTLAALDLIEKIESKGFLLNLDFGTMIENNESVSILEGKEHFINHVHISEPGLKVIEERNSHRELSELLNKFGYDKYISIEVGKQDDVRVLEKMMRYVKDVFG